MNKLGKAVIGAAVEWVKALAVGACLIFVLMFLVWMMTQHLILSVIIMLSVLFLITVFLKMEDM